MPSEPNFFIVGAPKSGTTALSRYLSEHEQIFVSDPKELFYFCSDFTGLPGPRTELEYLACFAEVPRSVTAVGEATAMYLYSTEAIRQIRQRFPDARLVVMLRNPIELAASFHAQQLVGRSEDVDDFERAWRLQSDRKEGRLLPQKVREPKFLQYGEVARLGAQVARLLDLCPRSAVEILIFDDFSAKPRDCYRRILDFLEVEDDNRDDFPVFNERRTVRHGKLANIINRPPPSVSRMVATGKRILGLRPGDVGILDGLRRWNSSPAKQVELRPDFRAELAEFFEDDVRLLSSLVDRDLTHWLA